MVIIECDNLEVLIQENTGLIYHIIKKYINYYDKEDLYQAGVIGIIKAYKNFNRNIGTKFSTYAYTYILSEVVDFVNNSKLIKTSKEYHKLYKKILEAKTILTQKLMHDATLEEISNYLELEESLIRDIIIFEENTQSLDAMIESDGKTLSLLDKLPDKDNFLNIDTLNLKDTINKLSTKEKELIYLRYYNDKTQSEVAKYFGTNQVNISRNEKKILKRLKTNLCRSP